MFPGSLWPHQLLATQRVQFDPQTTKHCYFALLQVAKRMSIEFVLFMSDVSIYFHLKSMANHLRQHPRHALASGDKTGCGGFTAIEISRSSMVLMHVSLLRLLTYKECTFYKINKLCKQILQHHRCCDLYTTYRLFSCLDGTSKDGAFEDVAGLPIAKQSFTTNFWSYECVLMGNMMTNHTVHSFWMFLGLKYEKNILTATGSTALGFLYNLLEKSPDLQDQGLKPLPLANAQEAQRVSMISC